MKNIKPDEIIDLKGIPCPQNSAKTLLKLAGMDAGEILEVIVDDGEPKENVPASIETENNYQIMDMIRSEDKLWHIFVKVLI
jgi:TusA-related sulfurtransferase